MEMRERERKNRGDRRGDLPGVSTAPMQWIPTPSTHPEVCAALCFLSQNYREAFYETLEVWIQETSPPWSDGP